MRGALDGGNVAEKVFLKDCKINYCSGCGVCNSTHKCVQHDDMADMFEKTTTICQKPKKAANWLIGEASRLLKEKGQDAESLWFSPMHLAQLIDLVDAGTINNNTAKEVFTAIFEQDVDPSAYVEAHGLGMVNDDSALEQAVSDVLASNPKTVEEYKSGKTKVLGFLVGQVMKAMKGKANPGKVNEMMTEKLNA